MRLMRGMCFCMMLGLLPFWPYRCPYPFSFAFLLFFLFPVSSILVFHRVARPRLLHFFLCTVSNYIELLCKLYDDPIYVHLLFRMVRWDCIGDCLGKQVMAVMG